MGRIKQGGRRQKGRNRRRVAVPGVSSVVRRPRSRPVRHAAGAAGYAYFRMMQDELKLKFLRAGKADQGRLFMAMLELWDSAADIEQGGK